MAGTACVQCGRALAPADQWCGLCFAPAPDARFTAPLQTHRTDDPAPVERPAYRQSRWAGSSVTFGPAGRIVLTLVLVAITALLLWSGSLVGLAAWLVVAVPWALRDIWRTVRVRR